MNKTAKIINISNVSGGVGKSTTAIELATYFGMQGKKVLIVDADMQVRRLTVLVQKDSL